ncbi:MAG: hypothetical protein QF500_05740 [Candidatus Thalassarchaeaceae archaeon]|jgi:hypothetical protein|nr:hypothetical protein [Candidatus Thalassarchaeaceae archaeon]
MFKGVGIMWIFTTKGFISIVQHNSMPEHYQVKSRVPLPIEELWPDYEIEIIDWADYRYRITIPKIEVAPVLIENVIGAIDYTSFKDECRNDESYYYALTKVWSIMYGYQKRVEEI